MRRDVRRVIWIATIQLAVSIALVVVAFLQQRGLTEAGAYTVPAEWGIMGACAFFLIGIALGGLLAVSPAASEPAASPQRADAETDEAPGPSPQAVLEAASVTGDANLSGLVKQLAQRAGVDGVLLSTYDGLSVSHTLPRAGDASAASAFAPELVREAKRWRKGRSDDLRHIEVDTAGRQLWMFAGKGLILSVLVNDGKGNDTARHHAESVGLACERLWAERYGEA